MQSYTKRLYIDYIVYKNVKIFGGKKFKQTINQCLAVWVEQFYKYYKL